MRKTCVIRCRSQSRTHLCHDDVRLTMDIRGCETQEAKAGIDQQVLPAVVFHQTLPVIAAVIFQNEP